MAYRTLSFYILAMSLQLRCLARFLLVLAQRHRWHKPSIYQATWHLPPIPMQLDNHPGEFWIGTKSKSAFLDLKRLASTGLAKFRYNMLQNSLACCVTSPFFFFRYFSYFSAHLSHLS